MNENNWGTADDGSVTDVGVVNPEEKISTLFGVVLINFEGSNVVLGVSGVDFIFVGVFLT